MTPLRMTLAAGALCAAALPAFAGATLDKALAAFEKKEYAAAADLAAAVKDRDPDRRKALYLLGECRAAEGKWKEAEEAFRGVLDLNADAVPAMTGLGRALTAQGKPGDAKPVLEKAVKKDKADVDAWRALAECHVARGDLDVAAAALASALKQDRKDLRTLRMLVEVHLRRDDEKVARKYAETAVKAAPKNPMGPFLRGLVLDYAGDGKEAIAAYEKSLALDDTFLDAHKNLAILCTTDNPVYSDTERTKKAFKHYARYFELGGKDEELRKTYETIKGFLESNGFETE